MPLPPATTSARLVGGLKGLLVLAGVMATGFVLSERRLLGLYPAVAYTVMAAYAVRSGKLRVGQATPSQLLLGVLPHTLIMGLLGVSGQAFLAPTSTYRVVSAALSAFVEEAFFRGALRLEAEDASPRVGGPLSSAAFTLFHVPFREPEKGLWLVPSYFVLGETLRLCYVARGWAGAALMHFVYNVAAYLYVALNSLQAAIVVLAAHVVTYAVARLVLD